MKIIYWIVIVWSAVLLTSCSDWLSVSPKTEKPTERLFSTQNGFRDALTGAYIEMSHDNSYGEYMTMSKIDFLVNFWNAGRNTGEEDFVKHNYKNSGAESIIANIYGQQYKVILAVNSILEHIDAKKGIFSPGVYETIKGECLALRAHCHLDILRLWGPVPTSTMTETPILSYVKTVSKEIHWPVTYEAYKTELFKDLVAAEQLLKTSSDMQEQITDGFYKTYNIRMNYFAVKGLQARAHLWFGERDSAYSCAMKVIESKTDNGNSLFRLGTAVDMSNKDYILSCEHIFALYRLDMYKKYMSLYQGHVLYKDSRESTVKKGIYGNTGSDIREMNLWELLTIDTKTKYYISKKYMTNEKIKDGEPIGRYVPLIRLSEMYLIAIETGPVNVAQKLWEEFILSRNLSLSSLPTDPQKLQDVLVAEYRKEFYGEGQVFYQYKRFNLPKERVLWAPATINYVLPLPKTEIINQ